MLKRLMSLDSPLDQALTGLLRRAKDAAPGVSVYLASREERRSRHAGLRDASRPQLIDDGAAYPLGAMIRPLVALLFLDLAEAGRIDLDTAVETVLPDLSGQASLPPVSFRHLLSQTGGFADPAMAELDSLSWEDFAHDFARRRQAFPPGSVWSEGCAGDLILATALEALCGRPLEAELWDRVLAPLGVGPSEPTAITAPHQPTYGLAPELRPPLDTFPLFARAAPRLALTISDLGRVGELLAGWRPHPLSRHVETLRAQPRAIPTTTEIPGCGFVPDAFGLGLTVSRGLFGQHTADLGWTCALRFDARRVIAVGLNTPNCGLRDRLVRDLARLDGATCPAVTPTPGLKSGDLAGAYSGLCLGHESAWIEPDGACTIEWGGLTRSYQITPAADGGLMLAAPNARSVPFAAFVDPTDGRPALMIGESAFKRSGTAHAA